MTVQRTPSDVTGMDVAGPRLRELRTIRGDSLATVAERAGVTKGFLSLAERGRTRVSVPTLLAICAALDTTIGALFDYPEGVVIDTGTPLQMGGIGLTEHLLTPSGESHLQAMRTRLAPGGNSGGAYRLDCQTVFAYVLEGGIEVIVDGVSRQLTAGQSTTYPGTSLHEFRNLADDREAAALFVFAPPLSGTGV